MCNNDIEIFIFNSMTQLCESQMPNMYIHCNRRAQMQHSVIKIARSVRVILGLIEVLTRPRATKTNSLTFVEEDEGDRNQQNGNESQQT